MARNKTTIRRVIGGVALVCLTLALSVACASQDASNSAADAQATPAEPTPEPAPDFSLTLYGADARAEGETLQMSNLEGQPVVMNFWFPSCPPCVAEMPDLESVYQKHKADGVEFIGVQLVGLDTVADGKDFIRKMGITYPVGADEDGSIVREYGVTSFPTTVFIDGNQDIVRKWSGVLNEEKLEELVAEIMN